MQTSLWPCFECGARISKSARTCPSCGSKFPFGIQCRFCYQPTKISEAIESPEGPLSPDVRSGFPGRRLTPADVPFNLRSVFHESCYHKIFSSPVPTILPCPDCYAAISVDNASHYEGFEDGGYVKWLPCVRCGRPDPLHSLGRCSYCGLIMIPGFHHLKKRGNSLYHHECSRRLKNGCSLALIAMLIGCAAVLVVLCSSIKP